MSIIGPELAIDTSVFNPPLIENLSDRDKENPEGAGFDLRVGKIFKLTEGAYLGTESREIAKVECVATYDPSKDEEVFVVKPGEFYTVSTVEKVNLPQNITADITLRRTGYSGGIILT